MKSQEEAMLLRIYIGEKDRFHGRPLYESIVMKARELNLAGVTVSRGIMGFGADSRLHSAKLLEISQDLPVIIEMADRKDNLDKIMPFIDENVVEGLVTMEKVKVIKYRHA